MSKVVGLGHIGIFVKDVDKMLDFYTKVMGMTLTDRGEGNRGIFLSGQPETEHHEFVLAQSEDQKTNAQQISFKVASLQDLKAMHKKIADYGCQIDHIVNHGIAFGCYFRDPEDNLIEVYWSTGLDYPQPHGDRIDITQSEEVLLDILRNMPPKPASKPRYYGEDVGKRNVKEKQTT